MGGRGWWQVGKRWVRVVGGAALIVAILLLLPLSILCVMIAKKISCYDLSCLDRLLRLPIAAPTLATTYMMRRFMALMAEGQLVRDGDYLLA